jgi:hypothetical protein
MIYRIAVPKYGISETRKRADAAILCAQKAAYRVIEGDGARDTERGWEAMREVSELDTRKGGTVQVCGATLFFTVSK